MTKESENIVKQEVENLEIKKEQEIEVEAKKV
jgi:hypothetical protein